MRRRLSAAERGVLRAVSAGLQQRSGGSAASVGGGRAGVRAARVLREPLGSRADICRFGPARSHFSHYLPQQLISCLAESLAVFILAQNLF